MSAPLLDLKTAADLVSVQSASKKRQPETATSDFSDYLREQAEKEDAADKAEDRRELACSAEAAAIPMMLADPDKDLGKNDISSDSLSEKTDASGAVPVAATDGAALQEDVPSVTVVAEMTKTAISCDVSTPVQAASAVSAAEPPQVPPPQSADSGDSIADTALADDRIEVTVAAIAKIEPNSATVGKQAAAEASKSDGEASIEGVDQAGAADSITGNADLAFDGQDAGGSDQGGADQSADSDAQEDSAAPKSLDGDSRRSFFADAQALYGLTSALGTRHTGASVLPAIYPPQLAQLSQQMVNAAQTSPDGTVELSMSPDELGQLKVVLHSDAGKLHVTIQAERPETQDLLQRHLDGLERDFRSAGYSEVAFSFNGQRQNQVPRYEASVIANDEPLEAVEEGISLPAATAATSVGGLDLRI